MQSADGSVFDVGTVLGKDGKRIGKGGAPNFIASIAEQPRFNAFTIKEGRKPQTADEVAIDASTANKEHFKLGDKVSVVATAPRKDYTIVGTTQIAGVDSFGGATVVDMLLPEAQRMLGKTGFDQIEVAAKPGVTPEQLRNQLAAHAAADGQRPDRPGGGAQAVERHQEQPELPDDAAPRVRRHLAVRRRVHHLQHLLDHGRRSGCASSRCCGRSARRAARSCARSSARA